MRQGIKAVFNAALALHFVSSNVPIQFRLIVLTLYVYSGLGTAQIYSVFRCH